MTIIARRGDVDHTDEVSSKTSETVEKVPHLAMLRPSRPPNLLLSLFGRDRLEPRTMVFQQSHLILGCNVLEIGTRG